MGVAIVAWPRGLRWVRAAAVLSTAAVSLVVFEKVSLGFGKKTIVNELDLRIGQGERIGLIGPNGSGKSTLLKLLIGEFGPDSGRITRSRGLDIGWLPQDISIEGGRSLIDYVLSSVPGREAARRADHRDRSCARRGPGRGRGGHAADR